MQEKVKAMKADVLWASLTSVLGWVVVLRIAVETGTIKVCQSSVFFSWIFTIGSSLVLTVIPFVILILTDIWLQHLRHAYRSWRDPYHMVREWEVP